MLGSVISRWVALVELSSACESKRALVRNQSYENEFRDQVYYHANLTCLHMKGFAGRLVSKQRLKVIRKWPIMKMRFS